ncbi:hypothetical protein F3J38_21430 [Pantoea sp. Acro-805]|uniref:Uncharacterized protein n=1 Tax=Candidatus Pantoea formicae TaxID=2608355 RepID=A0ABX0R1W7_9GAMM|nr:hypothetical protein [Pantoea formicae]
MHAAKTFRQGPQKLLSSPLYALTSSLLLCPLPRKARPERRNPRQRRSFSGPQRVLHPLSRI